jgi:hypothetical protein
MGMDPMETRLVADRIRARGYQRWFQRFESLRAHLEREQKLGPFRCRDIMIGITDANLWNLDFTKGHLPKVIANMPNSNQLILGSKGDRECRCLYGCETLNES